MTTRRIAPPIYQINMWANDPEDAVDVDNWERALASDSWPQTGKGIGTMGGIGEFGWDNTEILNLTRPYVSNLPTAPKYDLWASSHLIYNLANPASYKGAVFKIKVPPGKYYVTIGYGEVIQTAVDITCNGVVIFQGSSFPESWDSSSAEVSASSGILNVAVGRGDLTIDYQTLITWIKVEPVVYTSDDAYPDMPSTLLDPDSELGQNIVAGLCQRDTALTERPCSLVMPETTTNNTSWTKRYQWKLYVPPYANMLHFPMYCKTSDTIMVVGFIGQTTYHSINEVLNSGTVSKQNINNVLLGDIWYDGGGGVRNITAGSYTEYDFYIDVRKYAGREFWLALVMKQGAVGGTAYCSLEGEQKMRWLYDATFHERNATFKTDAAMKASATIT